MSSDSVSFQSAEAPLPSPELPDAAPTETLIKEASIEKESSNPNPDPPKKRGRKKKEVQMETPPSVLFIFQEEEESMKSDQSETDSKQIKFRVNDLVWGKVRSHPWWPGQIYDPSLASEPALKIKKEDHLLIAYFGDKTFAWNEASALQPYQSTFLKMEKQSSVESFVTAVDSSLAEISRRVELAFTCNCTDKKPLTEKIVHNSGITDGTHVPELDNSVILDSVNAEKIINYIKERAIFGAENFNKLDVIMARAYLKAFDKYRSFPESPEFVYLEEFGNDPNKISESSQSVRKRGRPKKEETKTETGTLKKEETKTKSGMPKKEKTKTDTGTLKKEETKTKFGTPKKEETKTKFGTPKKEETKTETGTLKKRGRPKKEESEAETGTLKKDETKTKTETGMLRKRGRPKKEETEMVTVMPKKDVTQTKTKTETGTLKKRGRPRKEESETETGTLKKRGRPRKEEIKTETGTTSKRGRPRKLKWIKQVELSDEEYDPRSDSEEKPKKRGRPKKSKRVRRVESDESEFDFTSESDEKPQKIGRPKKSKWADFSDEEYNPNFESSPSKPKTPFKSKSPIKPNNSNSTKKRGRPKKSSVPTAPAVPIEYPSSNEMVSLLCMIAQDPFQDHEFDPELVEFFSKFKNSNLVRIEELGESTRSGRRVSKPKHMKDSYWTDVVLDTGSDDDENKPASNKKKDENENIETKITNDGSKLVENENVDNKEMEKSDKCTPTVLALFFDKAESIPSRNELNEIFRVYGVLREDETEINEKLNCAKIIFKNHKEAGKAFNSWGKDKKFGLPLLSYETSYLTSPVKSSSPVESTPPIVIINNNNTSEAPPAKEEEMHVDEVVNEGV